MPPTAFFLFPTTAPPSFFYIFRPSRRNHSATPPRSSTRPTTSPHPTRRVYPPTPPLPLIHPSVFIRPQHHFPSPIPPYSSAHSPTSPHPPRHILPSAPQNKTMVAAYKRPRPQTIFSIKHCTTTRYTPYPSDYSLVTTHRPSHASGPQYPDFTTPATPLHGKMPPQPPVYGQHVANRWKLLPPHNTNQYQSRRYNAKNPTSRAFLYAPKPRQTARKASTQREKVVIATPKGRFRTTTTTFSHHPTAHSPTQLTSANRRQS